MKSYLGNFGKHSHKDGEFLRKEKQEREREGDVCVCGLRVKV